MLRGPQWSREFMHPYQNTVASIDEDINTSFGKPLFQDITLLIAPTRRKVNGNVSIFVLIGISHDLDSGLRTDGLDKETKLGEQIREHLCYHGSW